MLRHHLVLLLIGLQGRNKMRTIRKAHSRRTKHGMTKVKRHKMKVKKKNVSFDNYSEAIRYKFRARGMLGAGQGLPEGIINSPPEVQKELYVNFDNYFPSKSVAKSRLVKKSELRSGRVNPKYYNKLDNLESSRQYVDGKDRYLFAKYLNDLPGYQNIRRKK